MRTITIHTVRITGANNAANNGDIYSLREPRADVGHVIESHLYAIPDGITAAPCDWSDIELWDGDNHSPVIIGGPTRHFAERADGSRLLNPAILPENYPAIVRADGSIERLHRALTAK